jgi:hypothetical protein
MNTVKLLNLILLFSVLFCSKSGFAKSDSLKVQEIEARVKNLENYKENLDQLYEISSGKLEQSINNQMQEQLATIEESKKILALLVWIGIPATLLGLLSAYFLAINKTKKLIVTKIESIVEHKREEIIKLIETQEFDSKLRKTKRLLILSSSEKAQEDIKKFFVKFKFKNVQYRIVDQYKLFTDYDVIIFNNEDGSFGQELINQYLLNASPDDTCFVAYTTINLNRDHRINFSNSPFTLYHSVLTTLKYDEILKLTEANN